jgi:hypothetical protein
MKFSGATLDLCQQRCNDEGSCTAYSFDKSRAWCTLCTADAVTFKGHGAWTSYLKATAGPCNNGGTCIDGHNNYTCSCPEHSLGRHCDFKAPCDNDYCYGAPHTFWRVRNLGACGWRPAVSSVTFQNSAGEYPHIDPDTVTADFNSPRMSHGPQLALDENAQTYWRPATKAGEVGLAALEVSFAVEFAVPQVIISATALGLGIGNGGGHEWSGGLQLQASDDGTTWSTVGETPGSDTVAAPTHGPPQVCNFTAHHRPPRPRQRRVDRGRAGSLHEDGQDPHHRA